MDLYDNVDKLYGYRGKFTTGYTKSFFHLFAYRDPVCYDGWLLCPLI